MSWTSVTWEAATGFGVRSHSVTAGQRYRSPTRQTVAGPLGPLLAAAALALLVAACGGREVREPASSTPASPSRSAAPTDPPSGSTSPTPEVPTTINLPDDAPSTFEDALSPASLPPAALVPPEAQVASSWIGQAAGGTPGRVALAWSRGDDPLTGEHGFVLWQEVPGTPAWRVVYALWDRPAKGVIAIRFEPGDATGDDLADLLVFEGTGGSGDCGTWRVVQPGPGPAAELWRERTCDTSVRIAGGGLEVRTALYEPGDAHCCPSAVRISRLEWDGQRFAKARSSVSPSSPAG